LSHRAHTEVGLLQGKIVDEWNFYQAKHIRAHEYCAIAEVAALLPNGKDLALKDYKKSLDEECGSPAEQSCGSPAKDSAVLRPLLAPGPSEGDAGENKTDKKASVKEEAPKEHNKENPDAREKQEAKSANHKPGAVDIQENARELERERELVERRANFYDASELFLEISIVLCSITLLAEMKLFWKLSFITTIIGLGVALWGMLGLH